LCVGQTFRNGFFKVAIKMQSSKSKKSASKKHSKVVLSLEECDNNYAEETINKLIMMNINLFARAQKKYIF
jgi:hypothetical protein